jgi:hypothetical protein
MGPICQRISLICKVFLDLASGQYSLGKISHARANMFELQNSYTYIHTYLLGGSWAD